MSELRLKEAEIAEKELLKDVRDKIQNFTNEVFLDTLDEEMIAVIICHKALSKLSDLSRARVIRLLSDRYEIKALTNVELLQELVNELKKGIREDIKMINNDLKAKSMETIQSFLTDLKEKADKNTKEENQKLLKSLQDKTFVNSDLD